jgi:membrane associated rhomboid family serine protease
VYGALIGYLMRQGGGLPKEILSSFVKFGLTFVLYNGVYGLNSLMLAAGSTRGPHIDLAAHAGGIASGLIFGFQSARPLELGQRRLMTSGKLLALVGAVVLTAGMLLLPVYSKK